VRYRLFLLDASGRVRARFGLESADNESAVKEALAFANGEPLEVWLDRDMVFRHPGIPVADSPADQPRVKP